MAFAAPFGMANGKARAGVPREARGNGEIALEMRRAAKQRPHDVPVTRFIRKDHHHAVLAQQADRLACAGGIRCQKLHAETRAGALGDLPLEGVHRRIIEGSEGDLRMRESRAEGLPVSRMKPERDDRTLPATARKLSSPMKFNRPSGISRFITANSAMKRPTPSRNSAIRASISASRHREMDLQVAPRALQDLRAIMHHVLLRHEHAEIGRAFGGQPLHHLEQEGLDLRLQPLDQARHAARARGCTVTGMPSAARRVRRQTGSAR